MVFIFKVSQLAQTIQVVWTAAHVDREFCLPFSAPLLLLLPASCLLPKGSRGTILAPFSLPQQGRHGKEC